MPSIFEKYKQLIKEAVTLYLDGEKDLPSHRVATFFSNRARTYDVSKVVDRIDAEEGHCPFLADKKK